MPTEMLQLSEYSGHRLQYTWRLILKVKILLYIYTSMFISMTFYNPLTRLVTIKIHFSSSLKLGLYFEHKSTP